MIVIGADTHKRTHALAAVDAGTGQVRGQREIGADETGHLSALRWARELKDERVWAIEDCRHVSRRLEQALLAAGERVVRVAPHRMGASRRGEREPGESDKIDALAVARAVVGDGRAGALPGRTPRSGGDGDSSVVRSPQGSRCGAHSDPEPAALAPVALCPELERSVAPRSLALPRQLDRIHRRLKGMSACARVSGRARAGRAGQAPCPARSMHSSASCSCSSRLTARSSWRRRAAAV